MPSPLSGEEPCLRVIHLGTPMEHLQEDQGERHVPILLPFALPHADEHPRTVDVSDPEMDHFRHP
jgi:hypothetical protein